MTVRVQEHIGNSDRRVQKHKWRYVKKNWQLYILLLPMVVYFIIFKYYPMYGVQIAFKNFRAVDGIFGSSWVGLQHFTRFFESYYFWDLIKNTLGINVYALALFPISIIVALSLNELREGKFKKTAQTITYAPHFISVVVFAGMIIAFLDPQTGIVNNILIAIGMEPINFMTSPAWFKSIFVWSNEWQNLGWGAIIYLAALAGVDLEQHESAKIDGATRLQRIWYINIPSILPTIIILLILNMGNMMSIGFEKILLLQNELNMDASRVIQTYVYDAGLLHGQYSYSTAVGLFNSIINLILLVSFNQIARRSGTSLW